MTTKKKAIINARRNAKAAARAVRNVQRKLSHAQMEAQIALLEEQIALLQEKSVECGVGSVESDKNHSTLHTPHSTPYFQYAGLLLSIRRTPAFNTPDSYFQYAGLLLSIRRTPAFNTPDSCFQYAGNSKPLRRGRSTSLFASASPTNCSLSGSHFRRRFRSRVRPIRWQTVMLR